MPSQSLVKEAELKMMPDGHLPHSFQVRSPKWSPAKIMSPVKLGFLLHPTSLSLTPTFLVYTNGFPFVGCLLLQIFLFSPHPALPHSLWPSVRTNQVWLANELTLGEAHCTAGRGVSAINTWFFSSSIGPSAFGSSSMLSVRLNSQKIEFQGIFAFAGQFSYLWYELFTERPYLRKLHSPPSEWGAGRSHIE